VIAADGSVDRAALAGLVFADDGARRRLEAILHPRIRAEMERQRAYAARRGEPLAVQDIPLFVESGGRTGPFGGAADVVLVVSAPEELRFRRAVQGRGMAPHDVRARLAAQASEAERLASADIVLDGSGPAEHLAAQLDAWLAVLPSVSAHQALAEFRASVAGTDSPIANG
jgi:dephospho-CoA kinase